ncbi:MAG TPA: LysM peptidoglycan-binding domain-containing protein [Pirellulales bacterium]|jgi:nucleoid-associated protein YgaU|nr:LysM peptidoglycan-binding domain-containing protein [Pirellulales bacterium]
MPRRAKIVLVSIVLTIGFVVALQFRKPAATKTAAAPSETAGHAMSAPQIVPPNGAPPLDLSANSGQTNAGANDPATRSSATPQETNSHSQNDTVAAPTPSPPATPQPASPTSTPPPAADANDFHTAAGSAPTKPAEGALPDLPDRFSGNRSDSPSTSDFHTEPSPDASPPQTHKIVDGDSLPMLAERYLGSASRAGEIFACNRDVLGDPELLPIGARLRIPSGQARARPPAGDPATAAVAAAQPAASPPPGPAVGPTPAATKAPLLDIGSSGLSPLPPIDPQSQAAGRIYVVQNGDTLSSIAQKVYGDSAHTDVLLQANREQLRSDHDIRAGMLLATP